MTRSLSARWSLELLYRQTDKRQQPVLQITGPLLEPNCAKKIRQKEREREMERETVGVRERLIGMRCHFLHFVDEAELTS